MYVCMNVCMYVCMCENLCILSIDLSFVRSLTLMGLMRHSSFSMDGYQKACLPEISQTPVKHAQQEVENCSRREA